ncbi:prolyl oligopeptidase family serine peptidase [Rhodohalobacter sp. 614A]|uniref:carboxylesterase family protein n=1 Tax=Rhodohalobacter sp. 614A TaxID=2908649 RepID=UPI001F3BF937|nr:prolyl oligopeptidase family serine peptidase [Rhodohalobacter sp. 614A]
MRTKKIQVGLFFFLILLVLWTVPCPSFSQNQSTLKFKEALALPMSHNYSRTAVYTDPIEWQLIHNQFEPPAEGKIVDITESGDTLQWQKVEINEEGRFSGGELRSGYLYVTIYSGADEDLVFWLNAAGHNMAYVNGVPRAGDIYGYGNVYLPFIVKKGNNDLLLRSARWGGIAIDYIVPKVEVGFLDEDLTLPSIIAGEKEPLLGAIRLVNSTKEFLEGGTIKSRLNGKEITADIPSIPPLTIRKVPFEFDPSEAGTGSESVDVELELTFKGRQVDETTIQVSVGQPDQHYSRTFISNIDGSVQYYGVAPQQNDNKENSALFLSVHGAGVEAIGQARAYDAKDWGTLVTPTNRRPRGFNWEDWGRMDALEVFEIAKEEFKPDPQRIYLTGHSMGGHGTWYLGATYPGNWAAIAPAAGYPSLRMYGSHDGTVPSDQDRPPMEKMLLRSSNPADVMSLIPNYKAHGVYILHGDADRVVPVEFARTMREGLGKFHSDFAYYEYPGGSHWYGDESVDWPPMFEFFRNHTIKPSEETDDIQFITANPGISHKFKWASVDQQLKSLELSRFDLKRNKEENSIGGTTENIARLTFDLSSFENGETVKIKLDESDTLEVSVPGSKTVSFTRNGSVWGEAGELSAKEKGPHRSGGFKEAFQHNMVFVYGTAGNREEDQANYNKARYDIETWYYRGNGAVDMIPDRDFDPEEYKDRGVILYGNSDTNSAWDDLLEESPIQVTRNAIKVGNQTFEGDDLGALFLYPRSDSDVASVAVISGTGLKGMKATAANQYFAGGSGFPDFFIFKSSMLKDGENSVIGAGFFDNQWKLDSGNAVFQIISN